ncbi:stage II sporulation protein M [Pontibacillus yanchengensis]|uniref:Stage II sporulation protein M n=2 Tax=Pontibacillus yanchengensis TaxID=462910 RepID=A0ACC7VJC7_9BACI|nr:stage II sporulation protein M [Pontibacillus yanchengensis]MYL32662.1 stage II sporulation protein M [Pontibacillus yanchengensis]MYL55056.1 stage II sporulation protein M [Pontibacillus yanchengensis]
MHVKGSVASQHVREYASIYVFVSLLFMIGIIFGAVIVNSMNFIQKEDLFFYLDRFFKQIPGEPNISSQDLLKSSFFYHVKYLLFIFILGLSIIGMPIIWILLFMKGVVVGFSVGFLVNQMGWYGLLTAAASIAPQNLIIIPVYIVAGSLAMIFSFGLIQKLVAKKIHQPIFPPFIRYSMFFLILLVFVGVAALIESFISPIALKSVIEMIYK